MTSHIPWPSQEIRARNTKLLKPSSLIRTRRVQARRSELGTVGRARQIEFGTQHTGTSEVCICFPGVSSASMKVNPSSGVSFQAHINQTSSDFRARKQEPSSAFLIFQAVHRHPANQMALVPPLRIPDQHCCTLG